MSQEAAEKVPRWGEATFRNNANGETVTPPFWNEKRALARLTVVRVAAVVGILAIVLIAGIACPPAHLKERRSLRVNSPDALIRANAATTTSSAPASTSTVTVDFQVCQPVLTPSGPTDETTESNGQSTTGVIQPGAAAAASCEVLLMEHSFAYSYGIPFVGTYNPPSCKFNRVVMNFTVTSAGRQFDRLALMYFGDTEVWRTSTAEPTAAGIKWTYVKDMSEYLYFWNKQQTIIFDLGNLIDSKYTGVYNTTLTATFFTSQDTVVPADLIVPISARQGANKAPSLFVLPGDVASNTISLPRNANRAVFAVSACGQATEEFWWGNVLSSAANTFAANPYIGSLYGFSPWREVQILIDGKLAGVQWPFPVIFTGGIVPGLWRPIVGLDAFDLREHELDITPWLGYLSDGKNHTFAINVVGIDDNDGKSGTISSEVGASWYVTGKIFMWLDDAKSITTGPAPTINAPAPQIALSQSVGQVNGTNETLTWDTSVSRQFSVASTIKTQKGISKVSWTQQLSYSNPSVYTDGGSIEVNNFKTVGLDTSSGVSTSYKSSYTYPLIVNSTYFPDETGASSNFSLGAQLTRGIQLEVVGTPVFPTGLQPFNAPASLVSSFQGSYLSTTQNGTASYFSGTNSAYDFGTTSQDFTFGGVSTAGRGVDTELYGRSVKAVNGTIVYDHESLVGAVIGEYSRPGNVGSAQMRTGPIMNPKQAIGRGPGSPKQALASNGRK